MLNKDLIDDADRLKYRIQVLEKQIAAFKEYDEKRKEYYKEIVQNYGAMEAYITELEDTDMKAKKIKELKALVSSLNRIIVANRMQTNMSEEEITKLVKAHNINILKGKIAEQKEEIKKLMKEKEELICRIVEMRNSNKNNTNISENE